MSTGTPERPLRDDSGNPGHEVLERSDAELLAATRTGDDDAYGELFRRHAPAATALARRLTGHPSDADDLVSEAFMKVLAALRNGNGPTSALRPYLLTAVRRVHVDRAVASQRVQPTDDMSAHDPGVPFVDPALAGLERTMVAQAYQQLPERWQMVLWHTEVEEMSPKEIAPLLGMSANAVAALALRARAGLREAYLAAHVTATSSPECERMLPKLAAFVRGSAASRERATVERHLHDCADCRGVLAELQDVGGRMRAVVGPLILGVSAGSYLADLAALPASGLALATAAAPAAPVAVAAGAAAASGAAAGAGAGAGAGGGAGGAGGGAGVGGWAVGAAATLIVVGAVAGAVALARQDPTTPPAAQTSSSEPSAANPTAPASTAAPSATVPGVGNRTPSPTSSPAASSPSPSTTTETPTSTPTTTTPTTTPSTTAPTTPTPTTTTETPTPTPTMPKIDLAAAVPAVEVGSTNTELTLDEALPVDATVLIASSDPEVLALAVSDGCQIVDQGLSCTLAQGATTLPINFTPATLVEDQTVTLTVSVSAPGYTSTTSTVNVTVKATPPAPSVTVAVPTGATLDQGKTGSLTIPLDGLPAGASIELQLTGAPAGVAFQDNDSCEVSADGLSLTCSNLTGTTLELPLTLGGSGSFSVAGTVRAPNHRDTAISAGPFTVRQAQTLTISAPETIKPTETDTATFTFAPLTTSARLLISTTGPLTTGTQACTQDVNFVLDCTLPAGASQFSVPITAGDVDDSVPGVISASLTGEFVTAVQSKTITITPTTPTVWIDSGLPPLQGGSTGSLLLHLTRPIIADTSITFAVSDPDALTLTPNDSCTAGPAGITCVVPAGSQTVWLPYAASAVTVPTNVHIDAKSAAQGYQEQTSPLDVTIQPAVVAAPLTQRDSYTGQISSTTIGGGWTTLLDNLGASTAAVNLPSSTVHHAELYWTGDPDAADKTARLSYFSLQGLQLDAQTISPESDITVPGSAAQSQSVAVYHADVTAMVQAMAANSTSGLWSARPTTLPGGLDEYRGWTLVIVTDDPDAAANTTVALYDGAAPVSPNSAFATMTQPIPGDTRRLSLVGWGGSASGHEQLSGAVSSDNPFNHGGSDIVTLGVSDPSKPVTLTTESDNLLITTMVTTSVP